LPNWLSWCLLGLASGALAKFLVPGRDPAGCVITVVLGIAGAFVGGLIGSALGWGGIDSPRLEPRSIGLATLGSIVVLVAGRLVRKMR
jgi:uncharacterized membrane protein YeaQ/YmgE (transglycosylase-associated protein family)